MRRVLKWILIVLGVPLGLAMALLVYSFCMDQIRFHAARNDCERGCIQDSGGLMDCRVVCEQHPDHYP
jgi:hypothetical protein